MISGERDPIPDRTCVEVVEVPGAHACVFSHARELVEVLRNAGVPAGWPGGVPPPP
jgi:hypothetical protein